MSLTKYYNDYALPDFRAVVPHLEDVVPTMRQVVPHIEDVVPTIQSVFGGYDFS